METGIKTSKSHIGRKISRIRELRGMKQEALAHVMGITQQAISKIEQSEMVEEETLEKVAHALGVTKEGIKAFSEEIVFNIISNTFQDFHDNAQASALNHNCTFNPIDKIVALYDEKVALLERLLASEKEKVELLKKDR